MNEFLYKFTSTSYFRSLNQKLNVYTRTYISRKYITHIINVCIYCYNNILVQNIECGFSFIRIHLDQSWNLFAAYWMFNEKLRRNFLLSKACAENNFMLSKFILQWRAYSIQANKKYLTKERTNVLHKNKFIQDVWSWEKFFAPIPYLE